MREDYVAQITKMIESLKDHELLYLLTLVKKVFGSR